MLQEQLWDYNVYQFERDQQWAPEIVTGYQLKNQNAFKTFRTLFCDLLEFKDNDRARETLEKAYNKNDNRLLEKIVGSCEEKLRNKITDQGYFEWRAANTLEALRKKIDPLTLSGRKFDQPALWPLIRQVSIFVRGPRILNDITIVDLPGISDTNESRANLTKEYIKSCDCVWIVSRIDRVVDDDTALRLLSTYGRVFKGSVAVICTRSDDNIANEQQQLAEDLQSRGQDMARFQQITINLKTIETQIAQAKSKLRTARASGAQAVTKNAEVVRLKAASVSLKRQRLASLVQARNAWVTEQLQEKAQHNLPAGDVLQVFCVSNSHYAAARGLVKHEGLTLEAAATGVPALRAFALTLPASKLLRELDDYKSNLFVFLKNLELWVSKSSVEPRRGLMQHVKRPYNELTKHMLPRKGEFERVLRDTITTPMRAVRHAATKAALEVTAGKSRNMHHSSIRAFIRKRGTHATSVCPEQCWNEEFSEVSSDKAMSAMPALEAELLGADGKLEAKAHKDLRAVITVLRGTQHIYWPSSFQC
ncbi:hypothetical protein BDY17DRAFT_56323 [Neohortaea acidophila]|uniref:P-loop containing nucleoside triphosphate hydrolase protein n=1 Tax=Neohortaea acidophila TaxID=245834 RepID=A0A6A6PFX1_9PEZI|nr:uncharacterized protein BDY17DRAFT_56323 [Neohortaea acidophila]KAF2478666.1 hypothetical protein BDY17DRAFT_56323 [Neohortaea acidophila]